MVASGAIAELTGSDRGLLVEVDERPDELAAVLRSRGLDVEVDGNRLVVAGLEGGAADAVHDQVRDALVTTGCGVRRLTNRTLSLEDVFLEVGT